MKIFKIVAISLLVFFVLMIVGLFVFLKTVDINKYIQPITQQIGHRINRQVNIGHAGLGLYWPLRVSLDVENVTISDDPYFSQQDFLRVDKIHLGLDIMPLLTRKEIHISDVKIISPRVSLIRLGNGQINIETMAFGLNANVRGGATTLGGASSIPSPSAALEKTPPFPASSVVNLPSIIVKSIVIDHAQIFFQDRNPQLPLNILIQDIKGKVNNFSLTQPFVVMLQVHMGDGQIKVKMGMKDLSTIARYDFRLKITDVKIEDCLNEHHWPALLKGRLLGELQGSGQSFEPQRMQENLKAEGKFSLVDARIEKLNILKSLLSKLDFIPGLSSQIEEALSSGIKDKLGSDITFLNEARTKVRLKDKIFIIEDTQLESNIFSLTAQGTVGFDLKTNIDVRTTLAADLSKELTSFVKPLKGLLDDQGRLYIPGKIIGQGAAIGYQPDVDYISKKVIMEEGSRQINKQLEKVLNKNPVVKDILNAVLGGGQDQETSNSETTTNSEAQANQPTNTSDQNQEQPTQKLINNVLKNILR